MLHVAVTRRGTLGNTKWAYLPVWVLWKESHPGLRNRRATWPKHLQNKSLAFLKSCWLGLRVSHSLSVGESEVPALLCSREQWWWCDDCSSIHSAFWSEVQNNFQRQRTTYTLLLEMLHSSPEDVSSLLASLGNNIGDSPISYMSPLCYCGLPSSD